MKTYQQYVDHLWETQEPADHVAQFAKGYEDFLQCPLQVGTETADALGAGGAVCFVDGVLFPSKELLCVRG